MILNPWRKIRQLEDRLKREMDNTDEWIELTEKYSKRLDRIESYLRDIAAEERPSSSGVVKRMAALAREGLKQ
jgi:hypothetical protein